MQKTKCPKVAIKTTTGAVLTAEGVLYLIGEALQHLPESTFRKAEAMEGKEKVNTSALEQMAKNGMVVLNGGKR